MKQIHVRKSICTHFYTWNYKHRPIIFNVNPTKSNISCVLYGAIFLDHQQCMFGFHEEAQKKRNQQIFKNDLTMTKEEKN